MWIVTSHKMSLPSKLPSAAMKSLSPRHALPDQPLPFHIYALLARPCQTSAGHSTAVHAEPCRARPALLELRDLKSPIGRTELPRPPGPPLDVPAVEPERRRALDRYLYRVGLCERDVVRAAVAHWTDRCRLLHVILLMDAMPNPSTPNRA